MRAVAYCRYSSDNQREESIDAQIRAIKDFCIKESIDLTRVYVDEAKTGTNDSREQFIEMIHDSNKKTFNAILVHKLDRFARNRYDSAFYKKKLSENGVKIISVLERLDDSPESIILESVLEGMAEYYSKNLSREVMKGMKETALDCKHNGGIPPLGYDIDKNTNKYIINNNESLAVNKIFNLYLSGYGYGAIAEHLNNDGFKTKIGRSFSKNSIRDILLNEKYTGVYVFNKRAPGKKNHCYKDKDQIIKIDGGMPQIIPIETFSKVQEKMNSNIRGPRVASSNKIYLLTGKIFCGKCNSSYTGAGYRGGRDGKKYYIYQCTNKKDKLCSNKDIRKNLIEDFVLNQLKNNIFSDDKIEKLSVEIIEYIRKTREDNTTLLKHLHQQKDLLSKKINNAMDLLLEGIISKDTVQTKINGMQCELDSCLQKINEIASTDLDWINKEKIKSFLVFSKNNLNSQDYNVKLKIINTFVDKVFIYDKKINVQFKLDFYTSTMESGKVGGGEGSRTPVRNHILKNFYGCSL